MRSPSIARVGRGQRRARLFAAVLTLGCARYESRVIASGPLKLPARTWIMLRGPMRAASDVGALCLQLPPDVERLAGTSDAPEGVAPTVAAADSLPARPLRITARFYRDDGTLVPTLGGGNARRSAPGPQFHALDCVVTPYRTHATYVRADVWVSDTVTVRKIWWESYPLTAVPPL